MRSEGFTLVELLVVIGILGILAFAFLPDLIGAQDSAADSETKARLQYAGAGVDAYERKMRQYPADHFDAPGMKVQPKADNGDNIGIEALVFHVNTAKGVKGFDKKDWMGNTDGDDHGSAPIQGVSKEREEILDAWGTPLAYFCYATDEYNKAQKVMLPTGIVVEVKPWTHADGTLVGDRKYQIVSAGKDGAFNTDDDLTYPARQR